MFAQFFFGFFGFFGFSERFFLRVAHRPPTQSHPSPLQPPRKNLSKKPKKAEKTETKLSKHYFLQYFNDFVFVHIEISNNKKAEKAEKNLSKHCFFTAF